MNALDELLNKYASERGRDVKGFGEKIILKGQARKELARLRAIESAVLALRDCHKGKMDHICSDKRRLLFKLLEEEE